MKLKKNYLKTLISMKEMVNLIFIKIWKVDPEKEKEKFVRDPTIFKGKFRNLKSPVKKLKNVT
jgi:hypothetical protein